MKVGLRMTNNTKATSLVLGAALAIVVCYFITPEIVFASAGQVQAKLTNAANVVKGILTALVVLVGICAALFIIIKRMPSADDPHEKNEVFKSVGRVCALVALAAAIIWLLPWVYSLFT